MNDSFVSYVIGLIVVILAVFIIKKVASCLIRSIVFIIAALLLAFLAYKFWYLP